MNPTAAIARFVTTLRYDKLPAEAVTTAKLAILDCLGVTLAGSHEEARRLAAISHERNRPGKSRPCSARVLDPLR